MKRTKPILVALCRTNIVFRVVLPLLMGQVAFANPNIIEPMPVYAQPPLIRTPLDLDEPASTQPLTYVTAAPTPSQQLRQQRSQLEQQTVENFSQNLEQQRLREERARAAKARTMFAQTFNTAPQQVVSQQVVPQKVVATAPATAPVMRIGRNRVGFGLLGGFANYPGLVNVRGQWSVGGFLSTERLNSPFQIDISYHYSNFGVAQDFSGFNIQDLDQHNIALGIKYKLFRDQRLRPYFGAVVAYTLRRYDDIVCGIGGCTNVPDIGRGGFQNDQFDSHAADYGAMVGLEIEINDELTLGADARYMRNAYYRENFNRLFSQNYLGWTGNGRFIEQSPYFFASIMAKFSF